MWNVDMQGVGFGEGCFEEEKQARALARRQLGGSTMFVEDERAGER